MHSLDGDMPETSHKQTLASDMLIMHFRLNLFENIWLLTCSD